MQAETTIDLLRHGECEGGHIYRGSTDVALSETGWQQMQVSADHIAGQWQQVVSSPLQRCRKFSEHITARYDIPLAIHDDLQETHFGDWEGKLVDDIWRDFHDQAEAWYRDPMTFSPPNGETTPDFIARVEAAFAELIQQYRGQHIGLVIHGGVIRVLLSHVLASPFKGFGTMDVPFASISRIGIWHTDDGYVCQLQSHNPLAIGS